MADRPNIVFLFPDQLRRDFLSCYGADFIDTPNIDSVAENGTRYEQAYSQSPICVPARNALLSGMNAIRNGITDNNHGIRLTTRPGKNGYVGKRHRGRHCQR